MGIRGQYRNKRDGNEAPIVAMFRALGVSVQPMDVPADLLCGLHGRSRLVEVKQEGAALTPAQERFLDGWRGDYTIVRSVEDVREVVAEWRQEAADARS